MRMYGAVGVGVVAGYPPDVLRVADSAPLLHVALPGAPQEALHVLFGFDPERLHVLALHGNDRIHERSAGCEHALLDGGTVDRAVLVPVCRIPLSARAFPDVAPQPPDVVEAIGNECLVIGC